MEFKVKSKVIVSEPAVTEENWDKIEQILMYFHNDSKQRKENKKDKKYPDGHELRENVKSINVEHGRI